jgi:hypothetical protein
VFEIKPNILKQFFSCLLKLFVRLDGVQKPNMKHDAALFLFGINTALRVT